MDPRGKVQLSNNPALPAKCVVCNRPANGTVRFIDWGFDIDFYGSVVFCVDCLTPVAEACGFIPAKEFKDLAEVLEISLDRGKELEADRDKLRNLLDDMLAYRPTVLVDGHSNSDSTDQELEDIVESVRELESESSGTESDSSESSTESRSKNVPSPERESSGSDQLFDI